MCNRLKASIGKQVGIHSVYERQRFTWSSIRQRNRRIKEGEDLAEGDVVQPTASTDGNQERRADWSIHATAAAPAAQIDSKPPGPDSSIQQQQIRQQQAKIDYSLRSKLEKKKHEFLLLLVCSIITCTMIEHVHLFAVNKNIPVIEYLAFVFVIQLHRSLQRLFMLDNFSLNNAKLTLNKNCNTSTVLHLLLNIIEIIM